MTELTEEEIDVLISRTLDIDVQEPELKEIYTKVATYYDKAVEKYSWTAVLADMSIRVQNYMEDRTQRILDIGAGTGLLGQELMNRGFSNLDALDQHRVMLKQADEKKVYKNIIVGRLGDRLDIPDKAYNAVVGTGLFWHGQATPDCFPEIIRILKPGGVFVCNLAERWKGDTPEIDPYTIEFEAKIQEHVKCDDWVLEKREVIENYPSVGNGIEFYCRKA